MAAPRAPIDWHPPSRGRANEVRVGDKAPRPRPAEVTKRVGQKDLAGKAIEAREVLKEEHSRVAKDQTRSLHSADFAAELHVVGRGVVLHLLAGGEGVL